MNVEQTRKKGNSKPNVYHDWHDSCYNDMITKSSSLKGIGIVTQLKQLKENSPLALQIPTKCSVGKK